MIINKNIKDRLPISDLDNWYVVADFDRTITNGSSKTSWSILASSNLVPKEYIAERQELFNFYRPIEISDTIDFDVKMSMMKEWFQKHIELFVKYNMLGTGGLYPLAFSHINTLRTCERIVKVVKYN